MISRRLNLSSRSRQVWTVWEVFPYEVFWKRRIVPITNKHKRTASNRSFCFDATPSSWQWKTRTIGATFDLVTIHSLFSSPSPRARLQIPNTQQHGHLTMQTRHKLYRKLVQISCSAPGQGAEASGEEGRDENLWRTPWRKRYPWWDSIHSHLLWVHSHHDNRAIILLKQPFQHSPNSSSSFRLMLSTTTLFAFVLSSNICHSLCPAAHTHR